jgi:AcrR family transcriptional regulator
MIIDVAAGLFATVGLRRTTMETIAAAAGRGRRTVYMYFRNKAEIYEAVVSREISLIVSLLKEVIAAGKSFDETLHHYSDERVRALHGLTSRNPLLIRDFAQGHSRVEKLRERLNKEELKILTPVFKLYLKDQNLSYRATPEEYALIFLNIIRGNDWLLTGTEGFEKDIHMSVLSTDLFIRGLGTLIVQMPVSPRQ